MHKFSVKTCYRDCNMYISGGAVSAVCGPYAKTMRYTKCVELQYKRAENCRIDCAVCI